MRTGPHDYGPREWGVFFTGSFYRFPCNADDKTART